MATPSGLWKSGSHYEVLGLIGQGGMGAVYKARDRRLDRLVALKFLSGGLLDSSDARESFQREAQAIAALSHPNIAVLYDVGETDGVPFLALEYLSGGSLEQRGGNRRLPVNEILEYARQLAAGLSHAHGHGIVHRDIKPANALFAETGVLKLVDFGLAQWRGARGVSWSPCGTPYYMAPELLTGGEVDQRCDVFAFGVLLYRLAAGRLPFEGLKLEDVVKRISRELPPPLHEIRPDLPKAYVAMVDECLRKEAAQRPASMALIKRELDLMEPHGAELSAPAGQAWDSPTLTVAERPAPVPAPRLPTGGGLKSWRGAALLGLAALAVAAVFALRQFHIPPGALRAEQLVVVLPFDCKITDPAIAGFCSGLHADLLPRLNQTRQFQHGFWTISAAELASQGIHSALEAGTRLRAELAIQGVVTFTGGEYRINLDLTDARNARLLRSRVLTTRDSLALPGVLLSGALDLLETRIAASGTFALSAAPTTVPGSYQLSVEARSLLLEYQGMETIRKAAALLERAIALDPGNAQAHALLAQAWQQEYAQVRDPASLARAAQAAETARKLKPDDPEVLLSCGRVLRNQGDFAGSIATLERAIHLNPTDPELFRLLALTHAENRQDEKTLAAFGQALTVNPRWWPALHSRAVYWFRKGQTAKAIADLEAVIGLSPGNADALRDLGIYLEKAGRIAEAERCLSQSLALRVTPRAFAALAYIRERQGRYQEAVDYLNKSLSLSPKDHLLLYNLSCNWSQVPGKENEARRACAQAIELLDAQLRQTPKDADAMARLAVCRARLGLAGEARLAIGDALQLQPNSISVLKKAALVAVIQRNNNEAVDLLVRAVKAGEDPLEIPRDAAFSRLLANPAVRQRIVISQQLGK